MGIGLGRATFASFAVTNYRRYFTGQAISLTGTWMQTVAQSWLVLQLSGSGTAVGVAVALQALPVLVLGPYGGVVADRVDKRKLMIGLQASMGFLALALGLLVVTGRVRLWQVFVLATLLGFVKSFENPSRQAFIFELVGPGDLPNAIGLNSVLSSVARTVGSAAAGVIIAAAGTGACFLLNAASFGAVVASLVLIDPNALKRRSPPAPRRRGQLRMGLGYAARTREIGVPLVMVMVVGSFAYEFRVVLPVVAERTFGGNSATYGFMTAAMGLGAVVGGFYVATRRSNHRTFVGSVLLFGGVIAFAAVAPSLPVILVALTLVGAASVTFRSNVKTSLQLSADPMFHGRVMGLWAVAFLGTTPIGGPIIGAISENLGGRWGLAAGAIACGLAGVFGMIALRGHRWGSESAPTSSTVAHGRDSGPDGAIAPHERAIHSDESP